MLTIICVEAAVALSIRLPYLLGKEPWPQAHGSHWIPELLALLLVPGVLAASWALARQQRREQAAAAQTTRLMDTVLTTSREWLWATGPDGRFTFSSPACQKLIGYAPDELLGRHMSLVIEPDDLAAAMRSRGDKEAEDGAWSGVVTVCRRKDGTPVIVEVSGRPLRDSAGRGIGFEGTTRPQSAWGADLAAEEIRTRVETMLAKRMLLTAFQPIRSLDTGAVIGAEALTRFLSSPGISPDAWFTEADSVGLGAELELVALETALTAAAGLPSSLYVGINVSPGACLDPRLEEVLTRSGIPARRIVLEVTERHPVEDYKPLSDSLAGLRALGVRIAVDDAGAGFASMRHILQLRPDLIKLDRDIISGIDSDSGQRALGAAMVGFAAQIGAGLVAEGIETGAELETVTGLGMGAGQGYLLGRPAVKPEDWANWPETWKRTERSQKAGGEAAGN